MTKLTTPTLRFGRTPFALGGSPFAMIGRKQVVFDAPNDEGTPDPKTTDPTSQESDEAKDAPVDTKPDTSSKDETDTKDSEKSDPVETKPAKEDESLLREVMAKKQQILELQARLANFDGIDPEEARKLAKDAAEAEKLEAERRGEFDRVKAMMAEEHGKELAKIKEEAEALRTELASKNTVIDGLTLGSSFSNSEFIKNELSLSSTKTRALYGNHFEVKDGVTVAYDKPVGAKDRTMLVDGSGNPLNFEDALKRIVDADPDKKSIMKARTNPGASGGTTSSDAKPKEPSKDGLHGAARIAAGLNALE